MAGKKIEHARARDHVDPRQSPEHRGNAAFGFGLGIHGIGIAGDQVSVGWQSKVLAHLRTSQVQHHGFDRAHGRSASAHVEDCRRSAPDNGRARGCELMDRDATNALGGVLNHGAC